MSIFSVVGDLFGKKEKGGDLIDTTPKWLQELGKSLGDQVNTGLKNYTPGAAYTGDLNVAGSPTYQEQVSLDDLSKYLGEPGTGSLFDQASGQVSDTLAGKYADPNSSPFIQAMSKLAKNQLRESIDTERGRRGARGNYYTKAGVQAESKLQGNSMDQLQALVGQFIQNERQNMLGAATTAKGLDEYKNQTVPLKKIAAGQTYGSLTRMINQANLESQYQDYIRQRTELSNNQGTATTLAVNQPNITPGQMRTPKYTVNNDLGNVMGALDSLTGGGQGGGGLDISSILKMFAMGGV